MQINPCRFTRQFIFYSPILRLENGRRHTTSSSIAIHKTLHNPKRLNISLCHTITYKYTIYIYIFFEKRKCDDITHIRWKFIHAHFAALWCPGAALQEKERHILKWRDGNSMSSPITAIFTFYRHHMLLFANRFTLLPALCMHGTFNVSNTFRPKWTKKNRKGRKEGNHGTKNDQHLIKTSKPNHK